MRIRTGLVAVACAAASLGVSAVTPPMGASSSASASVNLVAQNRGFEEAAKPFDGRSFVWDWSDYLSLFDTTPTGLFLIVQ
ncbi:MAG: hypothetical protein KBT68_11840 [bacterium]|nr:hypothetical protein [Candidatus Colisoma equi]